jgi:hypothetical protein
MRDLYLLVADRTMEVMIRELLKRSPALGIRDVDFEVIRHPNRDPGVFKDSVPYLTGARARFEHAIVLLDCEFDGAPNGGRAKIEGLIRDVLRTAGLDGWALPIAIEPELENWVWTASPHLSECVGWDASRAEGPRSWLDSQGLWPSGSTKPPRPKEALEATCKECRIPLSSAIHVRVARKVSLQTCTDPAFVEFRSRLQEWFPRP